MLGLTPCPLPVTSQLDPSPPPHPSPLGVLSSTDDRAAMTHSGLKRFIETGVDLGLLGLGLSRGSRICLALPNGPEAVTCCLALATRCPVAPINLDISEGAARAQLADLPAAAVVLCRGHGPASDRPEALATTMGIPVVDLVPDRAVAGMCGSYHNVPGRSVPIL